MVLLSLVSRNAGSPYLVVVVFCCFFFVVFNFFVFHCSWFQTEFCGAFFLVVCRFVMTFVKKKMGFLLPCISGHIKALTRRQLRGQSPLFVSMVFRLVVVFVINLFFFFLIARAVAGPVGPPWTCWARHIKSVNGFVFFRLSYFDYSDWQLFAIFIFEVDFSETYFMTSAENSV